MENIIIDIIESNEVNYESPAYWRKWIKNAKKAAKTHWANTKAAWDEFENQKNLLERESEGSRPYCAYWSSVKTLEPAYYSRTPIFYARREFEIDDTKGLLDVTICDRVLRYLIRSCDFDDAMSAATGDFIHGDKATTQVVYEHDLEEREIEIPVMPIDDGGGFVDTAGNFYQDAIQSTQGFYVLGTEEVPVNQKIYLESCVYNEILHTPEAKTNARIKDRAYYFIMTEPEARKRFGDEICNKINWKSTDKKRDEKYNEEVEIIGRYVEGWECWCYASKKVYWWSEQLFDDQFLDVREDPYGLREFFPSPKFIIGSKPAKNLYPTPIIVHLSPLIKQLHECQERIMDLTKKIIRRAIIDGDDELAALLNGPDSGEYVVAKNLQNIIEKGGLDNMILFVPVKELVDSISEFSAVKEQFKNEFNEWFGIPDILRGVSDPIETAEGQKLKAGAAHDRYRYQKKLIQQLALDSAEMMLDLALGVFELSFLAEICGVEFMKPEEAAIFPERLEALKNDRKRFIRIEIDSDSLSFFDEQQKVQRTMEASKVFVSGLEKIQQMISVSPAYAAVCLEALLITLESLRPSRHFQEGARAAVNQLVEESKKPQPPAPDYEQMKIQVMAQKNQIESFAERAKAQARERELDQKEFKSMVDAQKKADDSRIDALSVQTDRFRAGLEAQLQQFMMAIEQQRVKIEQFGVNIEEFKAQIQARESMMEEIRLAREADTAEKALLIDALKENQLRSASANGAGESAPPQIINVTPTMPPINLVIDAKQGAPAMKRRVSVVRDAEGNAIEYRSEDEASADLGTLLGG